MSSDPKNTSHQRPSSPDKGPRKGPGKGPGQRYGHNKKFTRPKGPGTADDGQIWLYGIHAVKAALANPERTRLRLVASRNAARDLEGLNAEPEILEPGKIDAVVPPGAVHQGLALLTEPLEDTSFEDAAFPADLDRPLILLDQVTDPQNAGAVLRSTAALGGRAVITTHRHSPPVTGTLAKAATGALEHIPYVRLGNLAEAIRSMKDEGYRIVGFAEEGPTPLTAFQHDGPIALALGAEGKGLRKLTRDLCDDLVHLPAQGPISSLNVSNAAAIALYHMAVLRERKTGS